MLKKIFVLSFVTLFLFACTSGVKRQKQDLQSNEPSFKTEKISDISISLTKEAKEKLADNLKFNQEELLDHVRRALDARDIIDTTEGAVHPSIEIVVSDIRVRSNFSAVMWGFMAGNDSITGDIVIKDPNGEVLDSFEVSVAYALGGLAGGQDDARMGWLYESFAEETLKELHKHKSN
ncbi:DUF4410 domain-containing protein [Glaciecola sp. SC05]|uniref:DUF4410 domain-containing protein n=1 Tax=Glaciecola sp. SC05 TaxID=1987355 RepID=UPI003528DE85